MKVRMIKMNEFINYFSQNFSTIFGLFIDHIQLTILAIIISILIGVPLGIIITYFKPSKNQSWQLQILFKQFHQWPC